MGRILKFGILLLLVIGFSNCKQDDLNPSVFINVDDDFYIDMFEDLNNGDNVFNISIKSIHDQNCQNAIIDYSFDIDEEDDQIYLAINDIIEPANCIPGNSPALISVPVENLREQGYKIQINLKDAIINNGSFSVNTEDYSLIMNTENGFELIRNILRKIPENTIWGYIGYEEESQKMHVENTLKDLESTITDMGSAIDYDFGFYSYFTVLENGAVLLEKEVENNFHIPFVFNHSMDYQEVVNVINNYCNSNPGMTFHVFNNEGEEDFCQ